MATRHLPTSNLCSPRRRPPHISYGQHPVVRTATTYTVLRRGGQTSLVGRRGATRRGGACGARSLRRGRRGVIGRCQRAHARAGCGGGCQEGHPQLSSGQHTSPPGQRGELTLPWPRRVQYSRQTVPPSVTQRYKFVATPPTRAPSPDPAKAGHRCYPAHASPLYPAHTAEVTPPWALCVQYSRQHCRNSYPTLPICCQPTPASFIQHTSRTVAVTLPCPPKVQFFFSCQSLPPKLPYHTNCGHHPHSTPT